MSHQDLNHTTQLVLTVTQPPGYDLYTDHFYPKSYNCLRAVDSRHNTDSCSS